MASGITNYFLKDKGDVLLFPPPPQKKKGGHPFQHFKQDLLYSFCVYVSDALAIVPRFVWKRASAVSLVVFRALSSHQYYYCHFATQKDPAVLFL